MNTFKSLFWGGEDEKNEIPTKEVTPPSSDLIISVATEEDFEEITGMTCTGILKINFSDYVGIYLTLDAFYNAIELKECYQLYDGDRPVLNKALPLASFVGRSYLHFRKIHHETISTKTLWKLWGEVKMLQALPQKYDKELDDMIKLISGLMDLEKQYGGDSIIKDANDIHQRLIYLKNKHIISPKRKSLRTREDGILSSFKESVNTLKRQHSHAKIYACECCQYLARYKYTPPINDIELIGYEVPISQPVTNKVLFQIFDRYLETHTTPITLSSQSRPK